jgi:hypothetical protein
MSPLLMGAFFLEILPVQTVDDLIGGLFTSLLLKMLDNAVRWESIGDFATKFELYATGVAICCHEVDIHLHLLL